MRWQASDGLLPDQSVPAWNLFDDAVPEDPTLGATTLTLSTDVDSENVYYLMSGSELDVGDPIIVESRFRVLASTASSSSKAAVTIGITVSPLFGNGLHVGVDEIFVLLANNLKGPSAVVDTDGQFHTYRIEANLAGQFDVYYDDVLTLSGASFSDINANGSSPRVLWGLASSFSTGTAEFEYLEHNANIATLPSLAGPGLALLGAALAALGYWAPRRTARS